MKHTPLRTCIVCRKKSTKNEFIKVVKTSDGAVKLLQPGVEGRGAYICASPECIKKCIKTKALNRVFKTQVDSIIYQELEEKFGNK